MFQSAHHVVGCAIGATDGDVGEVTDLYFDDVEWTVRYLVVATGAWLNRRKVLIAPRSLCRPKWDHKLLPATISMDQVRASPDIDTNKPVSRQHETLFCSHYQHPCYWENAATPVVMPKPSAPSLDAQFCWSDRQFLEAIAAREREAATPTTAPKLHLRSYKTTLQYSVRARDGEIGSLDGMLIAEEEWAIRYLIVQTGHWWAGHQVLLAVQWINGVSWVDSYFSVDVSRQRLIEAPHFNPTDVLDRTRENQLFDYFGRRGYWHRD